MSEATGNGELADTLHDLRKAAGLSGQAVGERAGRSQAWVSRFESGKRVPTPEDVDALCRIYRAPAAQRRHLRQLATDLLENTTPRARIVMDRGAGTMQERIGRIEATSALIRNYYPSLVPGLLQVKEYATTVFASGGDLPAEQQEKALTARMARKNLLDDDSRQFVFVVTEGVLRWPLGGPAVMIPQLEHLVKASTRPNVRLGVVPWTRPVSVAPIHGFDLFDARAVVFGTEVATSFITDRQDVEAFVRLFGLVEASAVFGDEARTLIAATADDYRSVS